MPFFCLPLACNRQIDSLDWRQRNLDAIPHDIDRYRGLEELLLNGNNIHELNKALFRLTKLKILDLSYNQIAIIPPDIANLTNLVELTLDRNDISNLPDQLMESKHLAVLDLSSNNLVRIPDSITNCTSLTHLALNDISMSHLPNEIGQLPLLRSLELRDNLIRSLPASITKLTQLHVLDLGLNELDTLPSDMGALENLRELYVDENDLETLPDQLTKCRFLEQIDVSKNKLQVLPEDIGDLDLLTDICLSENCLQYIPHSIGRLRRLVILKVDKNAITDLTQSIGSCVSLSELFLTENLLMELPSSIGNLTNLKILNADKNHLISIPPTIGGCSSLTVLSLRENKMSELPMDIGKCEKLTVLDLCSNKLNYLPFTINVLFKLQALWLCENQSQSMLTLKQERDPRTGVKVLTCYLLPQQSAQAAQEKVYQNQKFVGGPKVHFPDQNATVEDAKLPTGQFERHGTPHPKPQKLKKSSIDGHIIRHDGDETQPSTLLLTSNVSKKSLEQTPSPSVPMPAPRSALKHTSVPPTQYEPELGGTAGVRSSDGILPTSHTGGTSALIHPTTPLSHHVREVQERGVVFASNTFDATGSGRLKRINTPHYKGVRGALSSAEKERSAMRPAVSQTSIDLIRITMKRDEAGGLGLSIAGGLGSTVYKEGDPGLFISKINPASPAERAGLKVGDKVFRVNDTDVTNVSHEDAVAAMKEARDFVTLTVFREPESPIHLPAGGFKQSPDHTLDMSFMSEAAEMSSLNRESITTTLKRDDSGSPGFAVAGGVGSGREVFISSITPGGPADRTGKLMIGDRVLSINGTKMRGVRHDQAVALLTGHPQEEIYLIVQRDNNSTINSSPLPSTPIITSNSQTPVQSPPPASIQNNQMNRSPSMSVPLLQLGDTRSWDGKVETVELKKDGRSLGLSIVGGSDHSSHPFGIGNPGVFISKITNGSPAAKSHKLRVGDRILSVNERNVRDAKHHEAVEALKQSGSTVKLTVMHDLQPPGLREIRIKRKENGPLGIFIHGGVGSSQANPTDPSDEGIFVERVEPGVCAAAGLRAGDRLIEVNGESLLGCTKTEAAEYLKRSPDLCLLVCDGYDTNPVTTDEAVITINGHNNNGQHHIREQSVESLPPPPPPSHSNTVSPTGITATISPQPTIVNGNGKGSMSALIDAPMATSSPMPPPTAPKPSRIPPPPVAPKPTARSSMAENGNPPPPENPNPEKLAFKSKIHKFELEVKKNDVNSNHTTHLPPPEKKTLLSESDAKRLREEKRKLESPLLSSPEAVGDSFLDQLNDSSFQRVGSATAPGVIRTKKAENRAIAAGIITSSDEPLNDIERRAMEQQKRSEWRAARMKSIDQQREAADELMNKITTPLPPTIQEEPICDRIIANLTSMQRRDHTDPITGERSITITEQSLTKREREFDITKGVGADIGFADD